MNHQQILDKLAAKYLVQAIDDDVARLTFDAMCYSKHGSIDDAPGYVLSKLMDRWNCVLHDDHVPDTYQHKTTLILAVVLHRYGYADNALTAKAIAAIDALNSAVALSDDFVRKAGEIGTFLRTAPAPLKRKPTVADSITFYRAQDVIAIRLENRFYAAYVHELTGQNESPVIEYYAAVFDELPTIDQLRDVPACGQVFNDGVERISRFAIHGMKYLPDLANQIHLISACVRNAPVNNHLKPAVGLYTMSDLFQMQSEIRTILQRFAAEK